MKASGLTEKECRVLYYCSDSRGIPAVIQKNMGITKEAVDKIIVKLINLGLIKKEGDYYATEKGEKELENYANAHGMIED